MAIRSGSGGLKYPLLNRAQLQAQQNAAAASAGGSASASAYGANRRYAGLKKQLQYDAFESGMDRGFQAQQAYLDRGFRAEQAYFNREHERGAQLEAQRSAVERQAAQFGQQTQLQLGEQDFRSRESQLDRDFMLERDKAQFEQEQIGFEREIDARIEQDIRSGGMVLPPAAQRRLEELEATKAGREAQGLDPEQQAEFNRIYEQERRKVLRQAQPPVGPSTTGRAQQGTTYYDPQTGTFAEEMGPGRIPGSLDDKGQFQPIVAQEPDDGEYRKEITKRAESLVGEPNPKNRNLPYTHQQALEEAARQKQAEDEFFDPPQQEGAPVAAAPGQPAPLGMGHSVQQRSGSGSYAGPPPPDQAPTPMTAEERNALPPGTYYLTPNGEMRRKV